MRRVDLLEKLKLAKPGLAVSDLVPILTNFWFTGQRLVAYNGIVAISVPLKTEFSGAVHGKTLIGFLTNSRARKLKLDQASDGLLLKAASSSLKLSSLPPTSFLEEFDRLDSDGIVLKVTDDIKNALAVCVLSVSSSAARPDFAGIFLEFRRKHLHLYSTNGTVMSSVRLDSLKGLSRIDGKVAMLSGDFCNLLIPHVVKGSKIIIGSDVSMFVSRSDVQIFGHLVAVEKYLDYAEILSRHLSDKVLKQFVPIPTKLKPILNRASVVTDIPANQAPMKVSVSDGVVKFFSKSDRGEVKDRMKIIGDHPAVKTSLEPLLLKVGCDLFDKIAFTDNYTVMRRVGSAGEFNYLIASTSK